MGACMLFLRPCFFTTSRPIPPAVCAAYAHFFHTSHLSNAASLEAGPNPWTRNPKAKERLDELNRPMPTNLYPRIASKSRDMTCGAFNQEFKALKYTEQPVDTGKVSLQGRVNAIRVAGSKLVFLDLVQEGHHVQSLCNYRLLSEAGVTIDEFKRFCQTVRRGDVLSTEGIPHRTERGELSLLLHQLPCMLSPCLRQLPTELQDRETRVRNRHVDFLVNSRTTDVLRLRAEIIQYLRQYLLRSDYVEVQTPILAEGAGGAVARPFRTTATEFPERVISLRIAPELWLKRMVIGGFDRVFEIGPSFRNEGLDPNHNPEFTTCEFYRAYFGLEDLIGMTEDMFAGLARHVDDLVAKSFSSLEAASACIEAPFNRIDFIGGIESAINEQLPNLLLPDAEIKVTKLLRDRSIALPSSPTLPQLLDRLSATYLEPQCQTPTFIMHHPECLSPLAKCFTNPENSQRVAARAELFVNSQEIANMYEEENSPFEQRKKFLEQNSYRSGESNSTIDESYLEALEWGLPPTGGFGCGIDRLCMLMSGAQRIGDVLSFGSLRNVVALRRAVSVR
ncbi:hypothetical protein MMC11_008831 [Xylographa trunciseda]|nr:hypothetical protein [Xylographa trunciseda]